MVKKRLSITDSLLKTLIIIAINQNHALHLY